jgi:hypothetical protein
LATEHRNQLYCVNQLNNPDQNRSMTELINKPESQPEHHRQQGRYARIPNGFVPTNAHFIVEAYAKKRATQEVEGGFDHKIIPMSCPL